MHCIPTVNLPTNCFCSPGVGVGSGSVGAGASYIPLVDLLGAVASRGGNFTSFQVDREVFKRWRVEEPHLRVEAIFARSHSGGEDDLRPFSLRVQHNGERKEGN